MSFRAARLISAEWAFRFRVEESFNSKLQKDDTFELSDLIAGCPLFLSRVQRGKRVLPAYVAGSKDGITQIRVLPGV
ncbi:MAG: hypothetical protein IJ799_08290 [Bacteroidales bacterium]|nr:hypothetical protein [Bacteroidales bacterium]